MDHWAEFRELSRVLDGSQFAVAEAERNLAEALQVLAEANRQLRAYRSSQLTALPGSQSTSGRPDDPQRDPQRDP